MVPTSTVRDRSSLRVDMASELSPKTTPTAPLPLPRQCFLSSPAQHGLGRSSLKSANEDCLHQAIISSLSYRLERLSLSDEPVVEPPTRTLGSPVYNATSAATQSTTSKASAGPRLPANIKLKLFGRVSNNVKLGLRKAITKRRVLKKPQAQAPIPLPLISQCSPVEQQEYLIGRRVTALGGFSVSDALEAKPYSGSTRCQELFTYAVRHTAAQQDPNRTVAQPDSCYPSPATSTLASEVADGAMDEDEQQPLSVRPPSPMPMDVETDLPSNDAIPVPESGQAPFEVLANEDAGAVFPEPTDVVMSDEEQTSSDSEDASQMEPTGTDTDTVMSETTSTESVSSTLFNETVNKGETDHKTNAWPLEQPTDFVQRAYTSPPPDERSQPQMFVTSPGRYSPPGTSATIAIPEERPLSMQPLATSRPHKAAELNSTVGSDANTPPASAQPTSQRQVALIETTKPTPATNADATSTSTATEQEAATSTMAMQSTAGSSTPTPTPPQRSPTHVQERTPNAHASRVHQVLGKLGLSKQASKSTMPSISEEGSEDAEAEAFLAKYKSAPRRDLPKSQSKPAPPSSESIKTKGHASRSLMDDIMAGFGRSMISKSSQKQVPAAAQPTTRPVPPATNALNTSAPVPSTHHRPLPVVAGRHTGLKPTLPSSVVGTSRYVAASPSGRAPATVPATSKVSNTPPAVLPTQQASLPLVTARQTGPKLPLPSSVVGPGRQVAAPPSSGAPSTVSATGEVNGPSTQAGTPSVDGTQGTADETSDGAMDGVESGRRAVKGSRRVARAMARMGLTWKTVQQRAQGTKAALEMAQINAAPPTTTSSVERDIEELRSREWHAAQPPPPPEAIPYISIDEEPFEGDENDDYAVIEWILRRED